MDEPNFPHVLPSFTVDSVEPLRDFDIGQLGLARMMGSWARTESSTLPSSSATG
jgi:hypothetical protein